MKIFGFIFAFYILFLSVLSGLKGMTNLTGKKQRPALVAAHVNLLRKINPVNNQKRKRITIIQPATLSRFAKTVLLSPVILLFKASPQ